MGELSNDDRAFLHENFQRFGSAWSGGLEAIERDFELDVETTSKAFHLQLTLRAPPRLTYTIEVSRPDGGMQTRSPTLPEGPDLPSADRGRVEAVLKAAKELWLIEPPSGEVRILDLKDGINSLRGDRTLETRRLEHRAVFYLRDKDDWGDRFCLWIDLDAGEIEGVTWVEMPMDERGLWLPPKQVEFIEHAMKENGDFGVYGNVQEGLRPLVKHMEVSMSDSGDCWEVSAYPRDGHGHFLHFPIYKETGEIGAAAAGHMDPMPDDMIPDEED